MARTSYTTKIGARWYFYRRVPGDLCGLIGARFWKVSLHTDSAREAARLARPHIDRTDAEIAQFRRMIEAAKPLGVAAETVDRASLMDAVQDNITASLDGLRAARAAVEHRVQPVREMMGDDVANDLLKHGTIAAEWREAAKPALQRAQTLFALGDALRPGQAPTARPAASGGLVELFKLWKERAKPADRTADEAEVSVRQFGEINGALTLPEITRAHVLAFRSAMLQMPKHLCREDAALPVPRILEKFAGSPAERVSPTTARKRLGFVKTLMALALEEGLIEVNPASDVRIGGEKTAQERLAFDNDDLRRMFSTAPYKPGGERGAMFWLPLLGLLTGARAGELLQLTTGDVRHENGVTYLSITDDDGKALKTNGSRRNVPVHHELIRLGFLDYAKKKRERIFEEIPFGAAQISAVYSKKFNYWLRNSVKITDKRKVLHSLRHSFKTLCREAGVGEDVHDALTGHTNGSVGRRYGSMPLVTLNNAIRSIKCPVDLGRL